MKKFVLIFSILIWACKTQQNLKKDVKVEQEHMDMVSVPTGQIDPTIGLISDPNLPLVIANCTGCHNAKLVSSNRFTRDIWKEKIVWMQKTQNLWDLGDSEAPILDYLAKYYGPEKKNLRRAPLKDINWYPLNN